MQENAVNCVAVSTLLSKSAETSCIWTYDINEISCTLLRSNAQTNAQYMISK